MVDNRKPHEPSAFAVGASAGGRAASVRSEKRRV
jgi:hypothetical protein